MDIRQSGDELLAGSRKLAVLVALLADLCGRRGHRVLVFSQSVRMLHVIERCLDPAQGLVSSDLGVLRIDGSVAGPERARRVDAFNRNHHSVDDSNDNNNNNNKQHPHRVMLLTTGWARWA